MTNATVDTRSKFAAIGHSGRRFAIVLVSWLLAGFGVLSSAIVAGAGLVAAPSSVQGVLALLPLFAWISLAVMSVRWVQDRPCHWFWPGFGTLAGALSAIFFVGIFFFYVSALPLATYLTFWHLKFRLRGARAA